MSSPRLSVIIPTFNHARFIGQCIEGVLKQGYESLEILVVDDGSTDATREIVNGFGDPVRYIHQENQGQATARAFGIEQTSGELIGLLDSDDYWSDGFLASLVPMFRHPEVSIAFSNHDRVNAEGEAFEKNVFQNERPWLSPYINPKSNDSWTILDQQKTRSLYLSHFPHTPSGALFRRFQIQHLPDKRLRRGDDFLFFMDYIIASKCQAAFCTDVLWHLRTHGTNIRQMNRSYGLLFENDIFAKEELLRKHHPELKRAEKSLLESKIAIDYFDWAHGLSVHGLFRQAAIKYGKAALKGKGNTTSLRSILGLLKLPLKGLKYVSDR